jgi:hypothetical protein
MTSGVSYIHHASSSLVMQYQHVSHVSIPRRKSLFLTDFRNHELGQICWWNQGPRSFQQTTESSNDWINFERSGLGYHQNIHNLQDKRKVDFVIICWKQIVQIQTRIQIMFCLHEIPCLYSAELRISSILSLPFVSHPIQAFVLQYFKDIGHLSLQHIIFPGTKVSPIINS